MPKLYCSVYCALSLGCSSPKSVIGRKFAQPGSCPLGGFRMLPKGFGSTPGPPLAPLPAQGALLGGVAQLCKTNGVLKNPSVMVELPRSEERRVGKE